MNDIPTRILRRPEVEARTGMRRSTLYAAIAAGTFPTPIQLSTRTVGWVEADVEAWLQARIGAGSNATRASTERR